MLQINDLTFRIEGRLLLEGATATIPSGHKAGLVGRNGAGKSTLIGLVAGDLTAESGSISVPRNSRIGRVLQEAPGDGRTLIDFVLAADTERSALLAEAEHAADAHRIAEIQLRLSDISAHDAPSRAATILAGLGFDEAAQHQPLSSFSGGWRMRVALAALLFSEPDLLLLDEPTNYLDLEGALWLETYLKRYRHTVIVVSHDRDLLNRSVDMIVHLDQRKLTTYAGGYDQFERQRRERQTLQLKLKKRQDDARRHMEAFVERFRAKATKARQAQSRIKALARMEPIPDLVEERIKPFSFPDPVKPLPPPLIRFDGMKAGYGEHVVLRDVTLRLDPDDRIGLLGANGNGKSTFAKILTGRLEPQDGIMRRDRRLSVGYFAQHQLDELAEGESPYRHFRTLMPEATEAQVRAKLGAVGFSADTADTPAASLSGGEKARLLFALSAFSGPNLLVLDEPTNHLDVESREALAMALNDYAGAIVLISHDRHLIEAVADRLWLVEDGTVRPYDGDMDDYRALLLSRRRMKAREAGQERAGKERAGQDRAGQDRAGLEGAAGEANAERDDPVQRRREAASLRARIAPLKRAMEQAEARAEAVRREIAALDARLADTALYDRNPTEATELAKARAASASALARAEETWLAAAETYESARADAGADA